VSFLANHDAIRTFAGAVGDLTDDADQAVGYTREWLGIGYSEGRMFATVVETASSVRERLVDNYTALTRLIDASEQEITKAANDYRDTDQATAARIDATY
jgi:hypothetical protein